ncbi:MULTISPECIES: TauD/TfdA dioxygenase family protein [Pseudomonas]|jgi:alpha-ketoglutarate-dependent taurine dioxygenase|uniref:Alpha-ketoglutarate-dependent 2,4-dichlorophenoxyacetate dioxygenase n=1 Tax=Pseudomonas fluorescens TaxID=294 RepID=A0A5E6XD80_PSEFL|nr:MULTISPECIES: TauD/TfdA family dioxygenase [Pseudomonas]AZZ77301.1 taurine catabolism dioxygenase TauD [Pseudomonas sp. RU47]WNZ82514.1 TauD/TfdA family dioxygenase [Pseudomonas sp. P108]VVN38846.1 Alpha-ketoglutarate-dependent 2,4-dichlorophenoxyacetate dioxygenase [Pseudomonas fluorescens]VVQ34417.1 Alpha-ketoglutarate-dependent 2,4-dichlorophenoxyacetate dioxygenase [Pseudomonas fluorescens]
MLELVPVTEFIGTEVRGIDVNARLSDDTIEALYNAWISSTILLFRGQSMSPDQQLAFSRNFGELVSYTRSQFSEQTQPEILILSNITKDGKLIGSPVSGRVWHTDGHYLDVPPAGSMLHALEIPPEGGDTWFANMFAAYEALPEAVKDRIEHLKVVISRTQSRPYNYPDRPAPSPQELAEWIDVPQPLVRRHEVSGRKALYAGGNVPWRIEGLPLEESAPLVTFLQEFSVQPRFTYRHRWTPGDIILWDNRSAMHKATVYDDKYRRLLHRTTIGARTADNQDRNRRA